MSTCNLKQKIARNLVEILLEQKVLGCKKCTASTKQNKQAKKQQQENQHFNFILCPFFHRLLIKKNQKICLWLLIYFRNLREVYTHYKSMNPILITQLLDTQSSHCCSMIRHLYKYCCFLLSPNCHRNSPPSSSIASKFFILFPFFPKITILLMPQKGH